MEFYPLICYVYGKAIINSIKIQRWWRFNRISRKNLCKLLINRQILGKKHVKKYVDVYWSSLNPSYETFKQINIVVKYDSHSSINY